MAVVNPGMKFGRLTVIQKLGIKGHSVNWQCKCDCGNVCEVVRESLTNNRFNNGTKSCGCLKESLKQGEFIVCKKCNGIFQNNEFYFKIAKPKNNNIRTKHNICKKCLRVILNKQTKIRRARIKREALVAYSTDPPFCACCGETHAEFLTIDHINGGGAAHRKLIGRGSGRIYLWLKRNAFPTGFRVLCMNCNGARGLFGYCPHEREHDERHSGVDNKKIGN